MRSRTGGPKCRALLSASVIALALVLFTPAARSDNLDDPGAMPFVGPFALESKDGKSRLQLGLTVQLKLEIDGKDPGLGKPTELSHFVEARRIRPVLQGTLFSRDLSFYLQLSTAPGALELIDAYINYRLEDWVQARLGQFKLPFTRYGIQSFKNLTFVDWAFPVKTFGAERQMGAAIHNGYENPGRLGYELGVFTGVPARSSYAQGLASLYGEKLPNPSDLADPSPRASFHPEIAGHVAFNQGGIDTSTDTDFDGGPLRVSVGLSAAWDLAPEEALDFSLRLAPEILVKAYGFSLAGILYVAFAPTGTDLKDQSFAMIGGLIQGSALVHRQLELTARYAVVSTDETIRERAWVRATDLIDAATDAATKSALQSQYKSAGLLQREEEATIGFNVYLIGRSLKWQNDLSWLGRTSVDGKRNDVRFRSQVQLTF